MVDHTEWFQQPTPEELEQHVRDGRRARAIFVAEATRRAAQRLRAGGNAVIRAVTRTPTPRSGTPTAAR